MKGKNIRVGAKEAGLSSQTMQKEVSSNSGLKKNEDWGL